MKIDPAIIDWTDSYKLTVNTLMPRPIGLISTIGKNNIPNVAPFGSIGMVCTKPILIGFSISCKRDGQKKNTLLNIESGKDFVFNIVTEELIEAMVKAGAEYPTHIDNFNKFKESGLTVIKADIVNSPLVAESPINVECRVEKILEFGDPSRSTFFIIGKAVLVHFKDDIYTQDGGVLITELKAIGKLPAKFYCRISDKFEVK
jgi:flavin reductase (DIM6/NTAB) family NADH-FMN oxidoreductase RutF